MGALLQYLLISVKVVALKKLSFSDTQNPKTVNTLTVNNKHDLLKRDNLTQPIQMELSQKERTFCEFFFVFLKSILNFKHFRKKDNPHS